MSDLTWRPDALDDLLNSADGPVGQLVAELSERAALVARSVVRVRSTPSWSRRSDARPPGFTLASISAHMGRDSLGRLYGGVNAAADPAIFLEEPAEQLHERYPFLTTALWSLEGSV